MIWNFETTVTRFIQKNAACRGWLESSGSNSDTIKEDELTDGTRIMQMRVLEDNVLTFDASKLGEVTTWKVQTHQLDNEVHRNAITICNPVQGHPPRNYCDSRSISDLIPIPRITSIFKADGIETSERY